MISVANVLNAVASFVQPVDNSFGISVHKNTLPIQMKTYSLMAAVNTTIS